MMEKSFLPFECGRHIMIHDSTELLFNEAKVVCY